MILRKLWNLIEAGDPDLRGYVYGFPSRSRTSQESGSILPVKDLGVPCDHKKALCLKEECLFSWRFVFGYIAFDLSRAGQWYLEELRKKPWCPEDLKKENE